MEWRLQRRWHGNIAIDTDGEDVVKAFHNHQIRGVLKRGREGGTREEGETRREGGREEGRKEGGHLEVVRFITHSLKTPHLSLDH